MSKNVNNEKYHQGWGRRGRVHTDVRGGQPPYKTLGNIYKVETVHTFGPSNLTLNDNI